MEHAARPVASPPSMSCAATHPQPWRRARPKWESRRGGRKGSRQAQGECQSSHAQRAGRGTGLTHVRLAHRGGVLTRYSQGTHGYPRGTHGVLTGTHGVLTGYSRVPTGYSRAPTCGLQIGEAGSGASPSCACIAGHATHLCTVLTGYSVRYSRGYSRGTHACIEGHATHLCEGSAQLGGGYSRVGGAHGGTHKSTHACIGKGTPTAAIGPAVTREGTQGVL